MTDILKLIQSNDMLKIFIVLISVYLFVTYTKKESLYVYPEELDNTPTKPELPKELAPSSESDMTHLPSENELAQAQGAHTSQIGQVMSSNEQQAHFEKIVSGQNQLTSVDLLPKYDEANKFAKENPVSKLLKEQNFLISGYHVGINTVMQSNKLPYWDLRSAPPIPKETVGPWSQSSYDTPSGGMRRQLDVGP